MILPYQLLKELSTLLILYRPRLVEFVFVVICLLTIRMFIYKRQSSLSTWNNNLGDQGPYSEKCKLHVSSWMLNYTSWLTLFGVCVAPTRQRGE